MSSEAKSKRRGNVIGFDGIRGVTTGKRITNWNKNQPSGRWRKVEQIKVKYTYIVQSWSHLDKHLDRKHVCPYGMKDFVKKLLQQDRSTNKKAIPIDVKEALGLVDDSDYDQNDVHLNCTDEGDKGYDTFFLLYCIECKNRKLPKLGMKYKDHLPQSPSIKDILDNWDLLVKVDASIAAHVDICGTLLPNDPSIIAGPNNRRFILRPVDHADKNKDVHTPAPPTKIHALKRPVQADAIEVPPKKSTFVGGTGRNAGKTHTQLTKKGKTVGGKIINVTDKSGKWNTTANIASFLDPSVSMFKVPSNDDEHLAQDHCISIILAGANKAFSQEATLHNYEVSVKVLRQYYKKKLGSIEIEGKKLTPPVRTLLNDKNISKIQNGIVEAYKHMKAPTPINKAPYVALNGPFGKFYSVMNDGIQKFGHEFNGVFLRTVDDADLDIVNLPWALSDIPGGSMDHTKLEKQLLDVIGKVKIFKDPSFEAATNKFISLFNLQFPKVIPPSVLPLIFKCTTIESCDFDVKTIHLVFNEWPVALVADGCGVNPKARKILFEIFGLLSPGTVCSGHSAIGSLRRMTTSKTMQVEATVVFASGIRPVLKHFKLSGKSSSLLNSSLEIMEMKPLKAMTWSPTRMGNLLTSSQRTVEILFPLCDVLTSCQIKEDESAYFMSPTCFTLLHLFADLEPIYMQNFLRRLDTSEATLFEVFGLTKKFVTSMKDFKTPLLDQYLSGLREDAFGNVKYDKPEDVEVGDDVHRHTITLNYTHRSRRVGPTKMEEIEQEAKDLKTRIVENLSWNAEDLSQPSTIVEYASLFDLTRNIDKATRIQYLRQLHLVYGKEYFHTVTDDDAKGDLHEYSITVKYPPKLQCSEDNLVAEFNSILPTMSKCWVKFKDSKPAATRMRRFWVMIASENAIEYPNFCDLIILLLAISPGTGPVERSFSKLAKICYKDRGNSKGSTLEILYLLSCLEIKEDDDEFCNEVKKLLQKK